MKNYLRKIYWTILKKTPIKLVINIENLFTYRRFFHKNRTEYFGEKIQWLKLYGNLEKYTTIVDKYKVREYIKEKIGEEYLIPLLGVYKTAEDINYNKLPSKFVIKANHGSGYNLIVKDKKNLDIKKTNKKLNRWLEEDYSQIKKEFQYSKVERRLVCEKYISDKNDQLLDFKFFCFDGKPEFIKVDFDRYGKHTANFYDIKWNLLDIKEKGYENCNYEYQKPENYDEMLKVVEKLCKEFQFVRVDLYNVDGKIYFGELTFTPASGKHPFVPLDRDKEIAKKIKLNSKHRVLMVGPARNVKGGMTTVVDNYYNSGLDKKVDLKYIETINDSNKIAKFLKEKKGMKEFKKCIADYDIVHIHMASRRSTFRKGKYVRIAKEKDKKVILHIHGAEYRKFYDECNSKQKEYVRKTLKLADKVIVLSEEWKEFFQNLVDKNKIMVVYNAIKLPNDFDKDLNTKKILFLGRIGQRKGIYDLLDVVAKIIPSHPDLKLYVGGDGEIENLQKTIKLKQLENNVEYIGWTSGEKKDEYLKKSSIYILPSYNEGMPMSVLEGMAYKNVTISTNVGGIPKVINNNKNGIIIDAGDKNALEEKLLEVLSDEKLRVLLSNNARKTIEKKFDAKKNVEDVINIYNNL